MSAKQGTKRKHMTKIDPEDPGKIGNTVQSSPAVHWCFTLNNWSYEDISSIVPQFQELCVRYVFQQETGEQGTPHLQGYIELKKKARLTALKKINNRINWSKTRNIQAAIDYAQKEDTRTGDIYKWGFDDFNPENFIVKELYEWQTKVVDLLDKQDERTILWIYEQTGNVGKTELAKWLYVKRSAMYITGGKGTDILHVCTEHMMKKKKKEERETFIFDFPRTLEGKVSYASLEQIKNGFWTSTKYEGGTVLIRPTKIVVFANWKPDVTMLSKDRWSLLMITDDKEIVEETIF